ncbi:DUF802 domain-containing protein [Dyella solisilvae]|uniref:DUF802 domain-containing protein n=1 Tax=Dyella solisilvae TaxID=1920168 RepID=A0A370K803_9GAMM|nr:DUF802 domain-containing protein [Dyella solisilvae]RDI98775.1 DUF802 domain-containing protein [Dyella solisilvae]
MFRHLLQFTVLLVGLAAVCWIGAGYVGSNPLGEAVALMIGACYLAGAYELHRYRQATATLQQAVAGLSVAPANLGDWLDRLHPSLRNATRLRIEGGRVVLPAPVLTPYLVGLLVLLGMLGTLLGMMATLRGTGLALESATDLQAIRGSLAAPVKGLGFAFGTSIAGVASSAMLGLLSALCRRERLQAVQSLDAKIATTLRVHSQAHQREEAFKLLQQQTALMPALVDRLQAMMASIEQQNLAAQERQIASHEAFHAKTETVYVNLASSVEQTLKDSVAQGARAGASALQPVVDSTMAGLAQQATQLHGTITQSVEQQLQALTTSVETSTTTVAQIWNAAVAEQREANTALTQDLRGSLAQFTDTFDQRSAHLLECVASRLDASANHATEAWNNALSRQQAANDDLAARNERALSAAGAIFEEHASSLVSVVRDSHTELQATLESRDQQRLEAWSEALGAMTSSLGQQWEQAGEHAATRQQEICDTLARTASDISAQAQSHASATIAEISRLVQAASEAPKVAAEVVAELRQKLSDSMVRDTAMLEERSRLLATLETLLDAVNHASTEQRTAVDALVSTSAGLLERVGARFIEHVEAETGKLDCVAAQITGSAVEVASLGEAFGVAVQLYGQSNEALMERLQVIADALDKSLVRSDEQLAYYVMQAREVVDLSMLSQKQIIEELQQIGSQRALAETETA